MMILFSYPSRSIFNKYVIYMNNTDSSKNYISLSKLINRLSEIEYYQTFAKTLLTTTDSMPSNTDKNNYVEHMFNYFIDNENLDIYENNQVIDKSMINSFQEYLLKKNNANQDISINLNDLKKLYANKCIVFPVALIRELQNS